MEIPDKKPSLYDAFKSAHDERLAFLFIDVLAGASGLWIPIVVGLLISETSTYEELKKLFESAGAYIFAIAFLSASSSFLYLERRKNAINQIRESYDRNAGWYAVIGIALGMLLIGIQLSSAASSNYKHIHAASSISNSQNEFGKPQSSLSKADSNIELEKPAKSVEPSEASAINTLSVIQLIYLLAAFWLGCRLFCLKNIEKIPGEFERIQNKEKEARDKIIQEAQGNKPF